MLNLFQSDDGRCPIIRSIIAYRIRVVRFKNYFQKLFKKISPFNNGLLHCERIVSVSIAHAPRNDFRRCAFNMHTITFLIIKRWKLDDQTFSRFYNRFPVPRKTTRFVVWSKWSTARAHGNDRGIV